MRPLPRSSALSAVASVSLVMAACSDSAEERSVERGAPATAVSSEPAVLNGVDLNEPLNVLGTEPFWSVRIRADGLEYDGVDRPLRRAANPGPQVQGTTAVWATATDDGQALVVTLAATPCSDGMSDRTYPLTARVEVGTESLNGCAATETFIQTTGEDGQPRVGAA